MIKFEFRYHSKQLSFIAASIIFLVLGILTIKGNYGGAEIHVNSPYAVSFVSSLISLTSIFVLTVFSANALLRDSEYKMAELINSTSNSKFQFLISRISGIIISTFTVMFLAVLGMIIGLSFADSERTGVFNLWYYIYPLLIFFLPNIIFGASILFSVSILSKSASATYVAGVFIYILYFTASIIGNSPLMANSSPTGADNNLLYVLIDPYGIVGFLSQIKTWGVIEKNSQLLELSGNFLINRIFWITTALLLFSIVYRKFSFRLKLKSKKKNEDTGTEELNFEKYISVNPTVSKIKADRSAFLANLKLEIKSIFKGIPFAVMVILWIGIITINLREGLLNGIFSTSYYATTGIIIQILMEVSLGYIFLIYYAAESIWRERDVKISGLVNSSPVSDSALFLSKLSAQILIIIILISLNILIGIIFQIADGTTTIELDKYISLYYYSGYPLFLFSILYLTIQTLISNKYFGIFISGLITLIMIKGDSFGIDHFMLRYAVVPELLFSDFNSFGHYSSAFNWYMLYWSSAAGILILMSLMFIKRNNELSLLNKFKQMLKYLGRSNRIISVLFLTFFAVSGGYIYYNTYIINSYKTEDSIEQSQFNYEKKYKHYSQVPVPVITEVDLEVQLYPAERKYTAAGVYTIKNKDNKPIEKFLITVDPEVYSSSISIKNSKLIIHDELPKCIIVELDSALLPGSEMEMSFSITVIKTGFEASNSENSILNNGSYIELEKFVPLIGYNKDYEIQNPQKRKKYGLNEIPYSEESDDKKLYEYNWINFEATISTDPDQEVVTTGNLIKKWKDNGRNLFYFKGNKPAAFMFAIASAKYSIMKTSHNDIDLEFYYHKEHDRNIDKILNSITAALDYYTNNYGKYKFNEVKIAEIPQYVGAATAYPNTLFFSEKIGFLLQQNNEERLDYTVVTPAHELSHQWWAYTLAPADVEGSKVLTETLAQYSEEAVLEKLYGKKYLRQYFSSMLETYVYSKGYYLNEPPLFKVQTSRDSYIYYNKGALIMKAVKELIGKENVNKALRNFLNKYSYPNKQATTTNLLSELYNVSSDKESELIKEWFTENILYDLKLKSAIIKSLDNGNYEVNLIVEAGKYKIEESGREIQIPVNEYFQIGLLNDYPDKFNSSEFLIHCSKYKLHSGSNEIKIHLTQKPEYASVDPYSYLIDKNSGDNFLRLND